MIAGLEPAALFQVLIVSMGAGVAGGILAGLLGVGGGIVIVPALYIALGSTGMDPTLTIKVAVGTSLATIIFTALSSARAHNKRGAIDWKILRYWAPSIMVGVVIGGFLGGYADGQLMILVFVVTAFLVALDMIFRKANDAPEPRSFPGYIWMLMGTIAGAISAMMGIGGGTVCVPIFNFLGYDIRKAVGTAAAIGFVIAVPGAIVYAITGFGVAGRPPFSFGYINLLAAAAIIPLTTIFAPLGARLAHTIPRRVLRLAFGAFLMLTAMRMVMDLI